MRTRYIIVPVAITAAVMAVATSFGAPADYPGGSLQLFYQTIINNGRTLFQRPILAFNGNFTVTDDKPNGRTIVTLTGPTVTPVPTHTLTPLPTSTAGPTAVPSTPTPLPTIAPPATPVSGAPVFTDQSIGQGNGMCANFTMVTSAPSLVICDADLHSNSVTVSGSPTYSATPLALVSGPINGGPAASAYMYKLKDPPSGNQPVVFCFSGTVNYVVACSAYTNAATTGTPVTDIVKPASVTVSSAVGHLVHDTLSMGVSAVGAPFPIPGAGQNQRYNVTQGVSYFGAGSDKNGALSTTMAWTMPTPFFNYNLAQIGVDIIPPTPTLTPTLTPTPTATPTSTPTPTPTP